MITGASSGLGRALAQAYAAPGVRLGLIARDRPRLAEIAAICRERGAKVEVAALDVGDAAPLAAWLETFVLAGPVDLVIANAGISGGPAPGSQAEGVALATRQVRTNLLGAINTVEPLLPDFIARKSGRIAVVASVAGYRGLPYSPGYSASKAGVRIYGESLRALLAPAGISVTVVCPGFFSSPMTDRFKGPTPLLFSLDRAAAAVKAGIDRRRSRVAFPWPLVLGLRLADLIPAALGDRIMRRQRFHIVSP